MAQIIIPQDDNQRISKIISPKHGRGGLFLGSQKAASDPALLKSLGITGVITIAKQLHNKYGASIQHMKIDIQDQPLAYIYPHFQTTYDFLKKQLSSGNVFVHCKMGISRSASVIIGYLMRRYKCGYDKAFTQVKKKRHMINPNQGFVLQLKEYGKNIKKSEK